METSAQETTLARGQQACARPSRLKTRVRWRVRARPCTIPFVRRVESGGVRARIDVRGLHRQAPYARTPCSKVNPVEEALGRGQPPNHDHRTNKTATTRWATHRISGAIVSSVTRRSPLLVSGTAAARAPAPRGRSGASAECQGSHGHQYQLGHVRARVHVTLHRLLHGCSSTAATGRDGGGGCGSGVCVGNGWGAGLAHHRAVAADHVIVAVGDGKPAAAKPVLGNAVAALRRVRSRRRRRR